MKVRIEKGGFVKHTDKQNLDTFLDNGWRVAAKPIAESPIDEATQKAIESVATKKAISIEQPKIVREQKPPRKNGKDKIAEI